MRQCSAHRGARRAGGTGKWKLRSTGADGGGGNAISALQNRKQMATTSPSHLASNPEDLEASRIGHLHSSIRFSFLAGTPEGVTRLLFSGLFRTFYRYNHLPPALDRIATMEDAAVEDAPAAVEVTPVAVEDAPVAAENAPVAMEDVDRLIDRFELHPEPIGPGGSSSHVVVFPVEVAGIRTTESWRVQKFVGRGGYSAVYLQKRVLRKSDDASSLQPSQRLRALKRLRRQDKDQDAKTEFRQQLAIQALLSEPRVIEPPKP